LAQLIVNQYFTIYHKNFNTAEYQLQQLPWQPRHIASYSIRSNCMSTASTKFMQ